MKEYENYVASNPFTLSFGNKPYEYVSRESDKNELIEKISAPTPISHCFMISGVRGSGKTVMLTTIAKHFSDEKEWIVIDLNPEDDMREALAAKLYSTAHIKRFFVEKNFSFSFQGASFSLKGKNPILNIDDLLDKMFKELSKQGKKILVTIDEASNNKFMRQFALSFQMLIREGYPLFVLATGLFENISALENENNMTFLIRAPKIYLSSLNLLSIKASYQTTLGLSEEDAAQCAKLTKGYAFAFQLLGYLMFESKSKSINRKLLALFDQYLDEYAYSKIWVSLSDVERRILSSFGGDSPVQTAKILEANKMTKGYFSRYRDRLIKKGLLIAEARGKLMFALPRFNAFIEHKNIFDY